MEEDEKYPINGPPRTFNITQIITSLLSEAENKSNKEECRIRPSEYMKQMQLTTNEMVEYIKSKNKHLNNVLHFKNYNFEVIPSVVIFQQFNPGDVHTVILTIRNTTQVSRYLKSSCELDPFFSVEFRGICYSPMLAPGLSHLYTIKFTPEERRDYEYQLKFVTDTGEFVVPVIAIGARGILDFPDRFEIPSTAAKIPSSKSILIRNVGNSPVVFTLYSNNSCFWIEPSKGRIEEEQTLQFTVIFYSNKVGDFEGDLFLEYETGEKLGISLRCSTTNCNVRIDRGSIRMEDTYLSLSRSKTFTIHNRSDYIVKYRWMRFKDSEADNLQKERYKEMFHSMYDLEVDRWVSLAYYGVCEPEVHQLVYQRIYADEVTALIKENFQYHHSSFMFTPEEGEIWPQSSTDVTVLFHAAEVGEITSTAYLEITGRENRIPLSLYGMGKGPTFRLNVVTIDVGNIYLCSVHNYEIVAANKGHISGTLVYRAKPSDFGGAIAVTPESRTFRPDEHKSFNLSFSSNRKGDFVERVDFVIKESLEVLSLHIKGCIVCPTLHFDKESLNFETTALGFSMRREVCLHNLSLMPVTFSISVVNDGDQVPLVHEEFAKASTKPSFPSNPREFSVSPEEGVVPAQSFLKIKVIYTPNIERSGSTTMQVDMWDSDSDPVTLPIIFSGKVALLSVNPPEISIRFCFLNFPYSRSLTVENNSDQDGYFYFAAQPLSEDMTLIYSLSTYQGFVKARQSRTINITIITKALGKQHVTLSMLTMGEKFPVPSCVITCNGQGPVISTEPPNLDFGEVQVLQERIMKFSVISDSPIPAEFSIKLSKKVLPWSVAPSFGELKPNGSMEIEVKLYLRDAGKYNDNIIVLVVNSRSIPVQLTAIGVGCSVVFEPNIFPVFDMGLVFSHQNVNNSITMKNFGTRNYQIIWTNEPELHTHRGQAVVPIMTKFQIHPLILDLPTGGVTTVNCKLLMDKNGSMQEEWYVFGQIQGQASKRELIGVSTFKVTLTDPQISFSKKELTFRIDVCHDGDRLQQTDELFVTNQSGLDLHVQLSVNPPFHLISETNEYVQEMKITLVDGDTTRISLYFSIAQNDKDLYSKKYNGILWFEYDEHPNKDKIKCKGSVNFPNLILSPTDLIINCELGSSAETILTLTNNGPVSVVYTFLWLENSIEIERTCDSNYNACSSPLDSKLNIPSMCIQSEGYCDNRQHGSGDGPINLIAPPVNSPVSEKHARKSKSEVLSVNGNSISDSEVSYKEVRDFLAPMIAKYFVEDTELPALECLSNEPPKGDYIDEVLNIIPYKGIVPPYSIHHVHLGFHGFERLQIKATVECKIVRGPTERINILARADAIQFSVDTYVIDFGQQLFCQVKRKSFILRNTSAIIFKYKIDSSIPVTSESNDSFDINPLKIEPNEGIADAQSSVQFDVEHRPTILGRIDHQFKLEIGHLLPVTITVKAIGTYPQVYLRIPRNNSCEKSSPELGYTAIQSLTMEFNINNQQNDSQSDNFTKERDHLTEKEEEDVGEFAMEDWEIILPTDVVPSIVDIDMAFERLLAQRYIDENSSALIQYSTIHKKQPILQLFSPEYIIDMGYVIIGLTMQYFTTVINYGPWNVEIQMKKLGKANVLEKLGIVVQFTRQTNLRVGDSVPLHVTWHPTRDRYTERTAPVKYTIYLEVIHGCTIPITIKGIVTYPYITVSAKSLDFKDVIVGECLMMFILLKNEGLVDCTWKAKLSGIRKKEEELFYVNYDSNVCQPGHSEIIRICFKPRKTCSVEAKLNIIVEMGLELQSITLTGRGIEQKLNIIEPVINFPPIVPFTGTSEVIFMIENNSERPIELFWHHLDNTFLHENRIAQALLRYYKVEEILLPLRKPGETMPALLTEFYEKLVSEMARALSAAKAVEEKVLSENEDQYETGESESRDIIEGIKPQKNLKQRKSRQQKSSIQRRTHENSDSSWNFSSADKNCPSMLTIEENLEETVNLPTTDPEEIQRLLHCYIDKIHRTMDLREKMKDPVKELFANADAMSAPLNNLPDPSKPEKKVCIIFHGAPFTEYQETASKSAKKLGVPVLCIDKAITELLAFHESTCASQLRQIIDDAYLNYMTNFTNRKDLSTIGSSRKSDRVDSKATKYSPNETRSQTNETKFSANKKSPKKERTPRTLRTEITDSEAEISDIKQNVIIRLPPEDVPLKEFNKIPNMESLETLDPLSRYEYKIEAVLHLRKILSFSPRQDNPKSADRTSRRKREETFLGIELELLTEALQERLAMEDFKRGFVLQSLNTTFFSDNAIQLLLILLRIVGNVEYLLFVTFLNSMANYERKVDELRQLDANGELKIAQRIRDIDEMSLSEYDLLSEEEKKTYLEAVLPAKKEEALCRRIQYTERILELKKEKDKRVLVLTTKTSRTKRSAKPKKKVKGVSSSEKKTADSRTASSKKGAISKRTKSRDSSKHRKQHVPPEVQKIITAMNQYYVELAAMENIIRNWDPVKKVVEATSLGRSRIPKTAKSRDKGFLDTSREQEAPVNKFHLWYVKPSDCWSDTMYNVIVSQINENPLAKQALSTELVSDPDLQPKIHSILSSKNIPKQSPQIYNNVYQLFSISPIPDNPSIITESTGANEVSIQENRRESKKNRRKSKRKSTSNFEDQKSLNTSTIENRDTNNDSTEMIIEEPLKPRWILEANESQKFKVRFWPEESGIYEQTYALGIINGVDVTYDINIKGDADIPNLNMNPEVLFTKVETTKTDDTNDPTFFLDSETFDFGSILMLRKDKKVHHREAELKFHNISKVDAEVHFSLTYNNPDCFSLQTKELFITPGDHKSLIITAFATKLGTISERLYLCIKNNPKVEMIELRSDGSKLDVALDEKQLSFNRILLYRREYQVLKILNKSPIRIFWCIEAEEPAEPQITFSPNKGMIKPWGIQEVKFCYYGMRIGVVEKKTMILKVFLYEDDEEAIFNDTIILSGETYDVAVDINHANPIDLKYVRVGFPTSAFFTIKNCGNYEVKYVIMFEDDTKLAKIMSDHGNLKENLEIRPTSGAVQSQKLVTVEVTFVPKNEMILKESPILKCHLVDTNKEVAVIAEIPLTVSLIAYYTRFRLYPFPTIDFGSIGVCTEKTIYFNIENTGKFPLHYLIYVQPDRHPSVIYMSNVRKENLIKKGNLADRGANVHSKKDKKSTRSDKTAGKGDPELGMLKIGPMTITKTEGDVDVGQTDTVAINCYPEFVGSQEEHITVLVADSIPEDRNGKTLTLSVDSCIPRLDFQDLDTMFQENYLIDRVEDFDCPKEIGTYTVFARQEKCLYFRHVCVLTTHVTRFKLINRNVISADVEVLFLQNSLTPKTEKSDTFIVEPQRERIPSMSYKTFMVSFAPTIIETFSGVIEVTVNLPPHLEDEKFIIKLVGESCVPEIAIIEPTQRKREKAVLTFDRTLLSENNIKEFALENTGFIPSKVIVDISVDPNFVFSISTSSDTRHMLQILDGECDEPNDRCTVIRLMPGNVGRFRVKFSPQEIGKHEGEIRFFIVDNPYENLSISLVGEAYIETVVLDGLNLMDNKRKSVNSSREHNHKVRKVSSKQNSLISASTTSILTVSLIYDLDFGACFINKMYKKTFKIANKSTNRWSRFQWNPHPDVVFVPSIGHLKYLTCKEITATFLVAEPTNHTNTCIECVVCEIHLADPSNEMAWDDRQTEVRWEEMDSGIRIREMNDKKLARKIVESTAEPINEIVPGTTKCIQVLLNATAAFSKYSCAIQEINFKDTLMFQTREYTFTLSNPGVVNTTYAWDISMDEQYPKKLMVRSPNATSKPRFEEKVRSRPTSKSLKGIFSFTRELSRGLSEKDEKSEGDTARSKLYRLEPHLVYDTIEIKPSSSSCELSDLFSSVAGLTGRSTDSWMESNNFPFTITPAEGSLLPRQSAECTLKFSPMDVFVYKAYLTCKIENVDPELPTLIIPIVARSLLPYCHFEVQESDYISSGRRDAKLPGPVGSEIEDSTLWENIRVIEFKVVGVGETHVKKFHMINPTTEDYHFSWKNRTLRTEGELSNFHCMVSEGIAERGKRTDLAFTFLAEDVGVYESFWLFSIERYNLTSLFLIVGVVTEPSVHCLTLHLKMKPTILGINVRETIRILNKEEFPIPFRILEESLYSEGKYQHLNVIPMTGILTPNNEQILWVEYHPTRVGEFQYSMQCSVKMMKKPITIFVTTTSYNIAPSISYVDTKGQNVEVEENKENIIDVGKLMTKSSITVNLDIRNSGEVAFYYSWDLGMTPEIISRNMYSVTMSQRQGYVTKESRSTCYLTLTAFQKTMIKEHSMVLKITGGPIYRFILKAVVSKPAVEFSFRRYDFGPCYIQENNPIAYQTELRLTNSDDSAFIIECKFEEKPHMSVGLEAISEALAAHSSITIPIIFRPLKEVKYREYLSFRIDASMERRITLTGEGITYKIRLVNPREKLINLGNIPVNKTVIKKIQVVNEARAPVELKFGLMKNLTGYQNYRDRIRGCEETSTEEETKKDLARASILETKRSWTNDMTLQTGEPDLSEVLEIQPSTKVVLEPNKRINVAVKFRANYRIRPFVSKVALETSSTILPLFVLHGSCIGAEFRLNRTYVSFGTIVEGCNSETGIMLLNTGDVGSRFKWNVSKLPEDLKIFPISGYSSPGMDTNFVVKFQPSEQHNLIEGEASIDIEKYGSLNVKITGGCCKLPEPIETVFFTSIVRDKQTKHVTIMNDTNLPWKLKPEAIGDCFSTEETLHVPSKTTISCRVTYAPVVMNTERTPHKGMLLFRFPDERIPILYSLHGLSLPPEVLDKIQRQFPAKTKYTESLPVFNWLGRKQQFECKIELLNGNRLHSKQKIPLYSFIGNNKIDIPPNSQRDYRGTFFSYEESNFRFKITFTNDEGEYQFYEIEYDVTKPEIMESIKLITTVRFPTCHTLKLENPLSDSPITYTAHCQHPYISIREVPKVVGALSHEYINIRYFPMLPTEETVIMLDVNCQELGYFPYELRLKAAPSLPEKVTRVNAVLGSSTAFSLSVTNYVKQNVQFTININNDSFLCKDKIIEVPASTDGSINIIYEPFDIENVSATLTASSNIAGEYKFPIIGTYSLPKPLGPYIVKPKIPASIPFKNVFKETKTFEFIFDIPKVFATETSSAIIKHKQGMIINVSIQNENQEGELSEEKYPVTGKLMVFCKDPKLSHINWIYYLKGIFD